MRETVTIDFLKKGYEGKVYSGRKRGELARQDFRVNELDESNIKVDVIIPQHLFSLTSSFFLGMFGPTLKKLGSKSKFKEKYNLKGSSIILEEIDEYIDRELRRTTPSM